MTTDPPGGDDTAPPVTAGRERDARETLAAVERLRRAALFGASVSRAAAIAEESDYISDYVRAALLPSPPATDGEAADGPCGCSVLNGSCLLHGDGASS